MDERKAKDERCGYCLERLIDVDQPRQLPCSHRFCLPCMQGSNSGETITCIICQFV